MAARLSSPESWVNDIERLRTDLVSALGHRTFWHQVWEPWPESLPDTADGLWAAHYTMLYIHSQAIAVRRIAWRSGEAIALSSVLKAIGRNSTEFAARRVAENDTDPGTDLRRLNQAVAPVAKWASENVAHLDRTSGLPNPETWDEIDYALDVIGEIINAYMWALRGEGEVVDFAALCRNPSWHLPRTSSLLTFLGTPGRP